MSGRITADPGRLSAYSGRTRTTIGPALDEAADYSSALMTYASAPNDLATVCPVDQRGRVESVLSDLATFDELPEAFARALWALDDRVGPGLVLSVPADGAFDAAVDEALLDSAASAEDLRRAAAEGADDGDPVWRIVWNAYDHPTGAYGSMVNLVNVGRWGSATSRLQQVESMADTTHLTLRWTGLNREQRRALAKVISKRGEQLLPNARAAALAAEDAMVTGRGPLAGVRNLVPARVATTASRLATPLGVVGSGLQAWETGQHLQDGEWVDAGFSGAGAAGGVLLLVAGGPVTMTVGGVLVLSSLAYEYRGEIADAAGWVADRAGDAVGAIGDGIGAIGEGVGDLASRAEDIPVIGGLFD